MSNPKKKSPLTPTPTPAPGADPATAALAPPSVLNAAASHAGLAPRPPAYDPAAAGTYLLSYRPRLDAIPAADVLVPRLDVRAASLAALGVYAFITQADALHARFQKQYTIGEFDMANDLPMSRGRAAPVGLHRLVRRDASECASEPI